MTDGRVIRAASALSLFAAAAFVAAICGTARSGPRDVQGGSTIEMPVNAITPAVSIDHPTVWLLDAAGTNVLRSGRPVSITQTCGQECHDVAYIEAHNYHAQAGVDEMMGTGRAPGGRPWDAGAGAFGRWDPLRYRMITAPGDEWPDMGPEDWVREFGSRHVGGGPAVFDSTGVEINCFVCHIARPDNDARVRELWEGRFEWSATATLAKTGLVRRKADGWRYAPASFDDTGAAPAGTIAICTPSSAHCGSCHGVVHSGDDPVWPAYGLREWSTETKGQVYSAQKMYRSAMNLGGKEFLTRSWDVHAERLMECRNCHYLLNDPSFTVEGFATRPSHLDVDTRGQTTGEFLKRPLHQFVKGYSASGTVAARLNGSMRRCEGCHNLDVTHGWLPYRKRHMERLLCESCHVPKVYSPARRVTDWTVITPDGGARVEYRGVEGPVEDPASLVTGFRPLLLPRITDDDSLPRLAPHNVIASWFWVHGVHGDPPRPVRLRDLNYAFLDGNAYRPDIVSVFDGDGNGEIEENELVLDSTAKLDVVRRRLITLGLEEPRVAAEIQPFSLNHGVTAGDWVTRSCDHCHSRSSGITAPFQIASVVPGGVIPVLVGDTNVRMAGELHVDADGQLVYRPATKEEGFYVLGHDRSRVIDSVGLSVILIVLMGTLVHGGVRYRSFRARRGGA